MSKRVKTSKVDRQLYDAVKKNKVADVRKHLEAGANPNAPVGKKGRTPMMRVAMTGNAEIEQLLIEKGGTSTSPTLKQALQDGRVSSLSESTNGTNTPTPDRRLDSSTATLQETSEGYIDIQQPDPPVIGRTLSRMSSLADSAGASFRRKQTDQSVKVSIAGDWSTSGMPAPVPSAGVLAKNESWELDRAKLKQVRKLGEGHFGVVFEGLACDLFGEPETRVAVKMLSETTEDAQADFMKEVDIMQSIDGDHNIVRLLGICTEQAPFLMVMELMARGDLKTVLRENRPKSAKPSFLNYKLLAKMGADVAEGMSYISGLRIVHRDLAARNCLVDDTWTAKVGDFGLGRDTYSSEYYKMTGSNPLPVRWMAPEAIEDGIYTTQSDIWSFGIVIFELTTFAKMPYGGLSNMEVVEKVTDGFRLPQPKECPDEFYQIMFRCWEDDDSRPSFSELEKMLRDIEKAASDEPIAKMKRKGSKDFSSPASPTPKENETEAGQSDYVNADTHAEVDEQSDEETAVVTEYGAYTSRQASEALEESQPMYQDSRHSSLSNFRLAVTRAEEAKEIQEVSLSEPVQGQVVDSKATEEMVDDAVEEPSTSAKPVPPKQEDHDGAAIIQQRARDVERRQTIDKPLGDFFSTTPRSKTSYDAGGVEYVPSRNHLANDTSSTAKAAQRNRQAGRAVATKEMTDWIEAVIGDYTEGSTLAERLKDGVVLCQVMNKIKPGAIARIHMAPRLAFKKMENIGYFLQAAKNYGLTDTVLFITIDLFEERDLERVVFSLEALKKLAESRGFKV